MPTQTKAFPIAALILLSLSGCEVMNIAGTQEPTAEQMARKQRSEAQLLTEGVPVNEQLPVIQSVGETTLRSELNVENRILCLTLVAGKADGMNDKVIQTIVRRYGLADHFSPWERAFIATDEITAEEFSIARWRYESAWALLWALGILEPMQRPDKTAEIPQMIRLITGRSAESFRADSQLRSVAEILDRTDLVYRYHAAVYFAEAEGADAPTNLLAGVVHERHHALNWLIGYKGQDWDEVTTEPESSE
jgi:hypothetical protein